MRRVFVGLDWAEDHHDVFVEDDAGERLSSGRLPEGIEGVARFHELVAGYVEDPAGVVVATETDRGLFVGALVAAGYTVLAVNRCRCQVSQELLRHVTHHPRLRQTPRRYARNRRLADACYLRAFAAITASPGAPTFYDQRRAAGDTHNRALRALANRLVGILHGCLKHHTPYDEHTAWAHRPQPAA